MRGIYTAGMGMLNSFAEMNTISNNLANANTTAFKKDQNVFKAILDSQINVYNKNDLKGMKIGEINQGVVLDEVYTDFTQGAFVETLNPLDFAIEGKGFFKIQRGDEFFYTRNGEFKMNGEGYLVTNEGDYVLDKLDNPIIITENFSVYENGNIAGTDLFLNIIDLNNYYKLGNNLFSGEEIINDNEFSIKQFFTESSNVNALNEMVKMIQAQRKFDILEKAVTTHDSLNAKIIEISSRG